MGTPILYGLMLTIIVLLSVQLHLTKKLLQSNRQNDGCGNDVEEFGATHPEENQDKDGEEPSVFPGNPNEDDKTGNEGEGEPDRKKEKKPDDKEEKITEKEKVLAAIGNRKKTIDEEDLARVEKELLVYFSKYANTDYFNNLESKDYYRFIDLRSKLNKRVVVIGDIHCDYVSLAALLLKLSVSEYDYFKDAYFVFLGDYLDRGGALFEPLLLLMDLKKILGDRMIMLKGNHESIEWDEANQMIKPRVRPHESGDCLNRYYGDNKEFLKAFVSFYSTLPIYVYLKTTSKNILLTHASVPRDIFIDTIKFDEKDGAMVFSDAVPMKERLSKRNKIFKDMIWGDPSPYEEKIQEEGRFEFGRKQFNHWVSRNHLDLVFRSHEEAACGYTPFFNDRLFTVFSTGGNGNQQTDYPNVEPAFAVIQNGRFFIENSFIYKVKKEEGIVCMNSFTKQVYTEKQVANYRLNEEFACDRTTNYSVQNVLRAI